MENDPIRLFANKYTIAHSEEIDSNTLRPSRALQIVEFACDKTSIDLLHSAKPYQLNIIRPGVSSAQIWNAHAHPIGRLSNLNALRRNGWFGQARSRQQAGQLRKVNSRLFVFKTSHFRWSHPREPLIHSRKVFYSVTLKHIILLNEVGWNSPASVTACFLCAYTLTVPSQLRLLIWSGSVGKMRWTSSWRISKSRWGRRATPIHRARLPFPSTTNYMSHEHTHLLREDKTDGVSYRG